MAATPAPLPPGRRALGAGLSPGDASAYIAATRRAMQDPSVQTAMANLRNAIKALRVAMLAKDSSLGPIIAKLQAPRTPGALPAPLTPAERDHLHNASEAMKGSPELLALEKARADFRVVMRNAVLKADPSVSAIFAKPLTPPQPRPRPSPAAAPSSTP